ncbi:hypothetical protein TPA0910_31470 [Streptomyces hygroscopicus subsp. sporocinereus]|uniref:Secreted protein n=1 Tax=Streptomyces hygroscopicus TaxID=1912 RepID=A0ABQ3TZA0_STRHY|nr:hypothetical protein TPA0910_31470 [Streptomyces hygroscopicus]
MWAIASRFRGSGTYVPTSIVTLILLGDVHGRTTRRSSARLAWFHERRIQRAREGTVSHDNGPAPYSGGDELDREGQGHVI